MFGCAQTVAVFADCRLRLRRSRPTSYRFVEIFVGWNRQRRFQQPATTAGVGDNLQAIAVFGFVRGPHKQSLCLQNVGCTYRWSRHTMGVGGRYVNNSQLIVMAFYNFLPILAVNYCP